MNSMSTAAVAYPGFVFCDILNVVARLLPKTDNKLFSRLIMDLLVGLAFVSPPNITLSF